MTCKQSSAAMKKRGGHWKGRAGYRDELARNPRRKAAAVWFGTLAVASIVRRTAMVRAAFRTAATTLTRQTWCAGTGYRGWGRQQTCGFLRIATGRAGAPAPRWRRVRRVLHNAAVRTVARPSCGPCKRAMRNRR